MALILISILTALIGLFSYYFYHWTYWKRRGIPHHLGSFLVGSVFEMTNYKYPPYLFIQELGKKYGKVFGITEGLYPTLVISDPDMVQEIFLKQFDNFYGRKLNPVQGDPDKDKRINLFFAQGHRWKRLRAISSPTFSNNSLRKLMTTVEDTVFEVMKYIEKRSDETSEEFDMLGLYQEFTIDIIGRIAMGQNNSKLFENPLIDNVRFIFGDRPVNIFVVATFAPFLVKIYRKIFWSTSLLGSNPIKDFVNQIQTAIDARIKQRDNDKLRGIEKEANGDDVGEDFIDLFLDAQADVDIEAEKNENFTKGAVKIDRHLTVDEIVGQCFVFLLAGFDTTALSLSYSTFLLSTHPNIQQKLQKEIDFNCPHPSISFEQLSKLKYLDCVIKETLRLYPLGALANTRRCMKATKIGDYEIEKGTDILVNTWALHYDEKYWGDDANEFKPERWEENDSMTKYANCYLPFGLGPRQCIGMRLAYMEEKLLLSHILRKYSFQTGNKTEIPLKLIGRSTTQPESLFVHLKPRF